MTKDSDLLELKDDLEKLEENAAKGYWVNNTFIRFKNAIKPCKFCGFCPYGQLVENFPLPAISRAEAIKHHEYMVKSIFDGVFDKPDPDNPYLMTKEEAIAETEAFNVEEYPETSETPNNKMACKIFGHHCPVYYHAELLAEEDPVTKEEIKAFETEINDYLAKAEDYHKKSKVEE